MTTKIALMTTLAATVALLSAAQAQNAVRKNPTGKAAKRIESTFSVEREAAAMAFVKANHPELLSVLQPLSDMSREQYERAIVDIFRHAEALTDMRERDPEKHALLLAGWQLKSRIDLAVARLAKKADDKQREQLRDLLEKQSTNHLAILRLDYERARARANRLEAELKKAEGAAASTVAARFERLSKVRTTKKAAKRQIEAGSPK